MIYVYILLLIISISCSSCFGQLATVESWDISKANSLPVVMMPGLYNSSDMKRNPLSNLAWEDGIYVSRDGLNLYCTYFRADLLSIVLQSVLPSSFYLFERGMSIGQNYTNPIPGQTYPWLHADVAVASRESIEADFVTNWTLSLLAGQFYNYGAPQGDLNATNTSHFDTFVFTHDSLGKVGVELMKNVGKDLAPGSNGNYLPNNVMVGTANVDNPHIERYTNVTSNTILYILFFDSDNYPNQLGPRDIWYTLSDDEGVTWTNASGVLSINTSGDEQQPHLWFNSTDGYYYLFYSATNPADYKLAIWRARQSVKGTGGGVVGVWDAWTDKVVIIGAGSSIAVGEASVTQWGDLSFVSITNNTINGTQYDHYDADSFFVRLIERPSSPSPSPSHSHSLHIHSQSMSHKRGLQNENKTSGTAVAGAISGALIGVVILGLLVWYFIIKKKRAGNKEMF